MKKTILLISMLIANTYFLTGQNIIWQKSYGGSGDDETRAIQQTTDGGYIVAGRSVSTDGDINGNHGLEDYWVLKLTAMGDTVWTKCYGGSGDDDAVAIQQTTDGGYIVAGYSWSTDGDVTGNHGSWDYWLLKLTATGDTVWTRCYGGSSDDEASAIQQTTDGGYIVAGRSFSTDGDVNGNHGYSDYWLLKLTATGDTVWTKCYGGSDSDFAIAIQQTTDDGYIVAGESSSTDGDVNGNHGDCDFWVLKLTATGDTVWTKCYGGSNSDYAWGIQQTTDGGYIVAGGSCSTNGDVSGHHGYPGSSDYWLLKLTATGDTVWTKCYGGSDWDYVHVIQQTIDGGYIVAGTSSSTDGDVSGNHGGEDYWVLKLTATGDTVWTKCYGGSSWDYVRAIQQTTDGGYIVAGYSHSTDGNLTGNYGGQDFWILKLDSSTTGIPLQSIEQMAVYPNPVHNQLQITTAANPTVVTIYNAKGQQVLQKNLSQKNATINISTLAKGSYIIELSGNDKIKVGKFVK